MGLPLEMATDSRLKGAKPLSIETPLAERVSVSQSADIPGASSCLASSSHSVIAGLLPPLSSPSHSQPEGLGREGRERRVQDLG